MPSPLLRTAAVPQPPAVFFPSTVPPGTPPAGSPTEALLADPRLWRAASLGASTSPCIRSGFAELDAQLPGGGWPTRAVCEILQAQSGVAEWRLLGPALRGLLQPARSQPPRLQQAGRKKPRSATPALRPVLLINPPHAPHLPGLRAYGLCEQQLVWIAPAQAEQALWATEQAIKANAAAALLAWLPAARPEQVRRLQAAALTCGAPVFLFRPLAAQAQSSAAPLRLRLAPGADWGLELQILKRRGPALDAPLQLPALPAALADVLAPRLLQPASAPPRILETSHETSSEPRPAAPKWARTAVLRTAVSP